jgi:hypothetical protein
LIIPSRNGCGTGVGAGSSGFGKIKSSDDIGLFDLEKENADAKPGSKIETIKAHKSNLRCAHLSFIFSPFAPKHGLPISYRLPVPLPSTHLFSRSANRDGGAVDFL